MMLIFARICLPFWSRSTPCMWPRVWCQTGREKLIEPFYLLGLGPSVQILVNIIFSLSYTTQDIFLFNQNALTVTINYWFSTVFGSFCSASTVHSKKRLHQDAIKLPQEKISQQYSGMLYERNYMDLSRHLVIIKNIDIVAYYQTCYWNEDNGISPSKQIYDRKHDC